MTYKHGVQTETESKKCTAAPCFGPYVCQGPCVGMRERKKLENRKRQKEIKREKNRNKDRETNRQEDRSGETEKKRV